MPELLGEDTQVTILGLEGEGADLQVVGRGHCAVVVDGVAILIGGVVDQAGRVGPDGVLTLGAAARFLAAPGVDDPQRVNPAVVVVVELLPEGIGVVRRSLGLQRLGRLNDQVGRPAQLSIGRAGRLGAGDTQVNAVVGFGMRHWHPRRNCSCHNHRVVRLGIVVGLHGQPADVHAGPALDIEIARPQRFSDARATEDQPFVVLDLGGRVVGGEVVNRVCDIHARVGDVALHRTGEGFGDRDAGRVGSIGPLEGEGLGGAELGRDGQHCRCDGGGRLRLDAHAAFQHSLLVGQDLFIVFRMRPRRRHLGKLELPLLHCLGNFRLGGISGDTACLLQSPLDHLARRHTVVHVGTRSQSRRRVRLNLRFDAPSLAQAHDKQSDQCQHADHQAAAHIYQSFVHLLAS